MKAIDILTAIAENYEVGNGIGIFTTNEQDYKDRVWDFFRGIKLVGEIEENSKYIYFWEYYNNGILGVEYDAVVAIKNGGEVERIYLYKIA